MLVQEKQLPTTEVEAIACNIFHAFLPASEGPRWLGSLPQQDTFARIFPVALPGRATPLRMVGGQWPQ